jgi:hypothetical protein
VAVGDHERAGAFLKAKPQGTAPALLRGAVVFYDWVGGRSVGAIDHVGLVKKDNGDGTITTIEGNTGNGLVEQRIRPQTDVVGYGYPRYRV